MINIFPSKPLQLLIHTLESNQPRYFFHIKQYIKAITGTSIPHNKLITDITWLLQQNQQSLANNIIGLLSEYFSEWIKAINELKIAFKNCKLNTSQIKASERLIYKISYLQKKEQTKKYTHILGISDKLRAEIFYRMHQNSNSTAILGEGAHLSTGILWMVTAINKYIQQTTNNQLFQAILDAFIATCNICKYLSNHRFDLLCQRVISCKMTIMVIGTTEHGFAISFYKNFLIISNNGQSINNLNTSIYHLTDDNKTIAANLRSLIIILFSCEDIHAPYEKIDRLVGNTLPVLNIQQKRQKYGTCVFVNQKTLLQGLLLVQYAYMKATKDEEVLDILKNDQEIRKKSYVAYKKFSTFLRQHAITELLSIAKDGSPDLSCNAIESLVAFTEKYKGRLGYLKTQPHIKECDQRVVMFLFKIANSQSSLKLNGQPLLSKKARQTLDIAMRQYKNLPRDLKLLT